MLIIAQNIPPINNKTLKVSSESTKEIDEKDVSNQLTEAEKSLYFTDVNQSFHTSGGMGFKAIMNDNFVVSLDFARPFDRRDGDDLKIYVNMNFNF